WAVSRHLSLPDLKHSQDSTYCPPSSDNLRLTIHAKRDCSEPRRQFEDRVPKPPPKPLPKLKPQPRSFMSSRRPENRPTIRSMARPYLWGEQQRRQGPAHGDHQAG